MELTGEKEARLELARQAHAGRKTRHQLRQLFWECTLRCDLRCRHCGSDCKTDNLRRDMPLFHFERILDEVKEHLEPARLLVVTTGGEPLMRPDIVRCGEAISRRGFPWGMVSNGMLLSAEKLDELIAAGLKTIAVSLDGFEREHNWMRGNGESFRRALIAITALTRRDIVWDVITCVNQMNIDTLPRFKEFLIGEGVTHWRIFTVFPAGRAKDNALLQLNGERYRHLMDFIADTRREGRIALSYGCEGFLGNREWEVRDYPFFCQAGVNVASVLSDGSISGCLSVRSDYTEGNIYRDNFMDVWRRRFRRYRDRSWARQGECATCSVWRFCEGGGMHLRDNGGRLLLCNLAKLREGVAK